MRYLIWVPLKAFCVCVLSFMFLSAGAQEDIPEVDEKLMDTVLSRLIYGVKCNEAASISPFDPSVLWVYDGNQTDAQKIPDKIRFLRFAGRILSGGIYDKDNIYISPDREFSYTLQGSDLGITSICDKQHFVLKNYDKTSEKFNLKLRPKADREIVIAINTANSMKDYVLAFKEIAPFVAKHILEDKEDYAKITLVSFDSYGVKDYDDVFQSSDFIKDVQGLKTKDYQGKSINYALIKGMSHFTKDNGLKKEIYLITDGNPSDMGNMEKMLYLTKNLNRNSVKNSDGSKRNWVTIHTLALRPNLKPLKDLSEATEGSFYEPRTIYEFKKLLLRLSNKGEDVNPKEIGNEIHSATINKIHDSDNPDNPPK